MIQLVFAHCNGIFGYKDELPWKHIPGDLKLFKDNTIGTILVMGPKTFMSLPSKLKGRPHLVLITDNTRSVDGIKTKDGSYPDHFVYCDEDVFRKMQESQVHYSVIGGVDLLHKAMDYADIIVVTEISSNYLKDMEQKDIIHLSDELIYKLSHIDKVYRPKVFADTESFKTTCWV